AIPFSGVISTKLTLRVSTIVLNQTIVDTRNVNFVEITPEKGIAACLTTESLDAIPFSGVISTKLTLRVSTIVLNQTIV
ncbi:hypothetical protein PSY80_24525, partial [Shigella flexneri]|nr:hypothetical protein [Shigella flexneri]